MFMGKGCTHVNAVPKEVKGDIRLPQADDCKSSVRPIYTFFTTEPSFQ